MSIIVYSVELYALPKILTYGRKSFMPTIQTKKKKTGRISSVLAFLLVFLLFLGVFGGLCLWAVVKINQERTTSEVTGLTSSASGITYTEEDARNLLLITVDGTDAQGFLVIRSDPMNTRIRTLALPRETVVDVGTTDTRLFELYAAQGVGEVQKAISKLMGLEFDNYAVITYTNIEKLVTYFENGIIYTVPEDLDYKSDDNSYFIKMSGGLRTLTASQVTNVLRYPAWHGGRRQRAEVQSELFTAMINQYMTSSRANNAQEDFSYIVNLLKSDIKVSQYNEAKGGLDYLASRNTGTISAAVEVSGEYVGSGDSIRFYVANTANEQLSNAFGNS